MSRYSFPLALLLLAVSATGNLHGQASAGAALPPPPALPDPARLAPYHQSLRMIVVRNGQEQEMGKLDDQLVIANDSGRPALIRIQNTETPAGLMIDTAVADGASLTPRWHSSYARHRALRLQFARGQVTGNYKEKEGPSTPIDQKVPERIFDSNMLDVLISALPLAEKYSGRLTLYLFEAGGPVPADVAVTGSESVGGIDSWAMNVTLGGRTARYYIAKGDHRVVQIVSQVGPDAELRLVRQVATQP